MKLHFSFLYFIFFICIFCPAQNTFIDGLKNQLKSNNSAEEKFKIYNELTEYYRVSDQYPVAEKYVQEQLKLAKNEHNYTEEVKALVQNGIIKLNQSQYDKVPQLIDDANTAAQKTNDKTASLYAAYLNIYYNNTLGESENTIKLIQKTLPQVEKLPSEVLLNAKLNYLLYGIHSEWNDAKNATVYAQKAVELAQKSGSKNMLSSAYSAMAVCYYFPYEKTGDLKDLKLVIEMCKKAVSLYQQFPGQVSAHAHALALLNLANYYLSYPVMTPEIRKEIQDKANEILTLTQHTTLNQGIQAGALGILSNLATRDRNDALSEKYLLKAEQILLTQKPVYYPVMINVVTDLSKLYEKQKNYQKAYEYQTKVAEYNNLLYNEGQAETAKRLEAQFQSQKKETELKALTEKTLSLKKEKFLYIGLGIIGLIGAFFMFRSYHYKLRYSIEREKKLNTEKHETEMLIKLQKEEQARLKAEQELLTLRQQKLQSEVLASQLHIQHKNEVLQQLQTQLSDTDINISQVVKEQNRVDNDFEKIRFTIQELHPDFFKNINEKAKQKLTPLDLKYCAYIYLGMDTKQIANLLNVEPKSVRMTKYRLKKKLGLDENIALETFFQGVLSE
ncbi:helix-turn-helix transcriptional regulator [Chryseobacterium sp. StRB126]|uniref:helix-turn-helix transcriptional regulator n=1 Tax=Chryseobacterium sp. StRB126 TaxID=878220 RepID=UPI0005EDB9CB|nr:LuxR C-terminal-related transcriptional regulator [Chryseobacterium sp. StRB126]